MIRASAALTLLALASAALAHDFWLEPKLRVARGERVDVPLRVGEDLAGEAVKRDDLRIETFVVLGPGGAAKVAGEEGADPAGSFTPEKDGVHVVAFRSKRRSIELEAAKFESYLKEEGLDTVAALRKERGDAEKPGREVYSRCAKALVLVGDGSKEGADRVAGLRLEILPVTNPYTACAGDTLTFSVVFDAKPLADALVVARSAKEKSKTVSARTDAKGRVSLALPDAGLWMLKCVHMLEAPKETGMDWESLWASLTFDLAPRAAEPQTK